jgi:hypothetical protein
MRTRQSHKGRAPGLFAGPATKVVVLSLVVIAVAALLLVAWQKLSSPSRTDYEGRIVDRWAENGGQAEGHQPYLVLVIESSDGKRFSVRVDPNVYESARVGMRIRSRAGQIVLIDSDRISTGNK